LYYIYIFKTRNDDDYDASVDEFENGDGINVELANSQVVESSTDMH